MSLFERVEIEINSHCDIKCFACDRFIDVAPTGPMTLEQINHFVSESLELKWVWKRVHILGGEPSLHPYFIEVVDKLVAYRKVFRQCNIAVISNGRGRIGEYKEALRKRRVLLRIEGKTEGDVPPYFRNTRVTPADEGLTLLPPCTIYGMGEGGCGLGLTKHGLFLCGAGASIARVTGQDIGIMSLKDLTHEAMLKQAETICHICGHWNEKTATPAQRRPNTIKDVGTITGPTWRKLLEEYKENKPQLSEYGK